MTTTFRYTTDPRERQAFARLAYRTPDATVEALAHRRTASLGHKLGAFGPPAYDPFSREAPTYTAMAHCQRCGDDCHIVNPDITSENLVDGRTAYDRCLAGPPKRRSAALRTRALLVRAWRWACAS